MSLQVSTHPFMMFPWKHHVLVERIFIKKNILLLLPSPKTKNPSKQQIAVKEKEKVVNVLTVLVKMSSGDFWSIMQLQNLQVTDVPALLAVLEEEHFWQSTKNDFRH